MASEGTGVLITELFFHKNTGNTPLLLAGRRVTSVSAGCPRRGGARQDLPGGCACVSGEGPGMRRAPSCLSLPLGHFPNLAALLVKGFSGTSPQTSLFNGTPLLLELDRVKGLYAVESFLFTVRRAPCDWLTSGEFHLQMKTQAREVWVPSVSGSNLRACSSWGGGGAKNEEAEIHGNKGHLWPHLRRRPWKATCSLKLLCCHLHSIRVSPI